MISANVDSHARSSLWAFSRPRGLSLRGIPGALCHAEGFFTLYQKLCIISMHEYHVQDLKFQQLAYPQLRNISNSTQKP